MKKMARMPKPATMMIRNSSTFKIAVPLKAVIPGGSSVPVVPGDIMMTTNMDYDSIAKVGSMLGSGAVVVMDETTDMVKVLRRISRFYFSESCGQCTPCREGSAWTAQIMKRIEDGKGTEKDLDTLMEMTQQMVGTTICVLSDSVAAPVQSSINKFREDYLALMEATVPAGVA